MRSVAIACVIAFVLGGCVTKPVPLDSASVQLQGKTLAVIQHKPSVLNLVRTKDAMMAGLFGVVGSAVSAVDAMSESKRILQDNQIADPTAQVRATVAQTLATNRGLQIVHADTPPPVSKDAWFKTYSGADYLLDVYTWNWVVVYLASRWDRYHIMYQVDLRLLDAATRKPIAQGTCKEKPVDLKTVPTWDEMFANGAALFKGYMDKAIASCTDTLLKSL